MSAKAPSRRTLASAHATGKRSTSADPVGRDSASTSSASGDRLPKYEELRLALAEDLVHLQVDDPLPSERDLMVRYGVSRMTVRQAIAGLAHDGLVYRVQGSGTFVADPTKVVKSLRLTSFSEDIVERRMVPGARLLLHEQLPADADIAHDLVLEPGTPVEHLERLRTADGAPMCLENVWLPSALVHEVAYTTAGGSLYEALAKAGVAPEQADQRIRATVLTARDADLLGVPAFSPALQLARVTYDARGRAVERAVGLYRADRYDFHLTVTRGRARG